MEQVQASGVVLAVRPRADGTFGITVGPEGGGMEFYWYRSDDAPKLGTDVTLLASVVGVRAVASGDLCGKLTVLDRVAVQVLPPPYARRIVAPEWAKRVVAVMSRPLYRYQIEGAAWLASRIAAGKGAILGDDPGCVEGGALVSWSSDPYRPGSTGYLSDLFLEWTKKKVDQNVWVLGTDGQKRVWNKIIDVVARGRKNTIMFRVPSLSVGGVRLTPDHAIALHDFSFVAADKIGLSDRVLILDPLHGLRGSHVSHPLWDMAVADVYDIVCEGPHHNFVANGVVVHNCGKSTQAIAAICATRMFPAIITCPTSVKINWAREFEYVVRPPSIEIVRGESGQLQGADVVILNHDVLGARKEQLANLRARCLILDEAQAFKSPKPKSSHRAAVATALASWVGRTIELSGTPIYNRLRDLWRLLHNADPYEWPDFDDFDERYCKAPPSDEAESAHTHIVTSAGRVEHLEELHARIEPVLLRRRKHEVLQDLPPQSSRRILVEMDEFDRRRYQQAEQDIVLWLRQQQEVVDRHERARAALRARTIVKLTTLRRIAAEAKMRRPIPDYLAEWFDRETIEPLVIFAHHKDIVLAIHAECQKILGSRVSLIGGKDSADRRQAAVDAFGGGYTDVFISPIRCGGVGLNGLQARGADVFFAERLWEPTMMRQGIARVHRLGQKRPVTATFMDAAGTIDEYMASLAGDKELLIAGVLDEEVEPTDEEEVEAAVRGADGWIDSQLSPD